VPYNTLLDIFVLLCMGALASTACLGVVPQLLSGLLQSRWPDQEIVSTLANYVCAGLAGFFVLSVLLWWGWLALRATALSAGMATFCRVPITEDRNW
jgi:hypothetical protein